MAHPIQYGPILESFYVQLFPAGNAVIETVENNADFVESIVDLDVGKKRT